MPIDSAQRKHWACVALAAVGIAVVVMVWSQFGVGDSQPMVAGETVAPPAETQIAPVECDMPSGPAPAVVRPADVIAAAASEPVPAVPAEKSRDEKLKEQFIGFWLHMENGEQWIENRADGTSRMLLKLDFISSLLYGQQTHLDLKWEVQNGILTHTIASGSPTANVDRLVKDFGKSRQYTIIETTPERMLLESKTDKKKDLWTRTPPPKEWAEGAK